MTNALRLGIAGLGTVGTGVVKLLSADADRLAMRIGRPLEITGVSARDRTKDRGIDLDGIAWHDDPVALARADNVDMFVELMGGEGDPAKAAVETALKAGKHVVTANKALLAHHGTALARLAEDGGVGLNYEAAVAGGIPIVKTVRESLAGNRIARVFGIMNGTCNFILTMMENEGVSFAEALAEAQRLGYAEADPTFDVGGLDTAHKLAILSALAFGTEVSVSSVYVEGIEHITRQDIRAARDLGFRIKLLGVGVETDSGVEQRVHPTLVPMDSPIADVQGVFNAVGVTGDFVGDLMLEGQGAGAFATASSVASDIVDIARGHVAAPFGAPATALKPYRRARMRAHEGGYYVALELYDRIGAVAAVAQRMAEQGISLDSIVQRADLAEPNGASAKGEQTRPVIMITHDTLEKSMREALANIDAGGHTARPSRMIRIERF
ncbi:homoserine dehydrogenase [Kaustia mangrovi]|uniref:Homoserine dehydrogenase n=1 Tax=Kaustia mangrovi TaxID=2593653 RepID=A0A7S8C1R5_9HYPH|nr:homoserine dehydrogenase [Kaustia mangrovi]QPC41780.1 homoserine dehydrogenase [Kaustia mangrovi]